MLCGASMCHIYFQAPIGHRATFECMPWSVPVDYRSGLVYYNFYMILMFSIVLS